MALSDKNIVITPNISSSTDDPKIVWSGASSTLGPQSITTRIYPNNNGTLSFEGSAGQLFSITNSLSGTIFSVNDTSGMPSITVSDTGNITLAPYSGSVTIDNGINGMILGTYTGGSGTAIYNASLTPSNANYSFWSNGATGSVNGTTGSNLAVNGTAIAAATSTGLAVTGSISASGGIASTAASNSLGATVFSGAITGGVAATLGAISATNLAAVGLTVTGSPIPLTGPGIEVNGGVGPSLLAYNRAASAFLPFILRASTITFSPSDSPIAVISSTGLAVTGAISATGGQTTLNSNSATPALVLRDNGIAQGTLQFGSNVVTYNIRGGADYLGVETNVPSSNTISGKVNGTTITAVTSTGLAVTGAISATGGIDKLTTATGSVSVAAATAPTTGQILTATSATTATWQAAPVSLPTQTGNTGLFLTTNGTTASWAAVAAGGLTTTDDTTTAATYYPVFATTAGGSTAKTSSSKLTFNPSVGTLGATIFNSLSDVNAKTNITPIENSVSTVNQLRGVGFEWKDNGKKSYGVIAQELEAILPDLVSTDPEGIKSVNYDGIIGFLINAVKEMDSRIKTLENK
jgi:hypothetical protein